MDVACELKRRAKILLFAEDTTEDAGDTSKERMKQMWYKMTQDGGAE